MLAECGLTADIFLTNRQADVRIIQLPRKAGLISVDCLTEERKVLTMAEYIEREALIKAVRIMPRTIRPELVRYSTVQAIIDKQPAADVVEIVRCKDCKFAFPYNDYYYCENEDSPFTNSDWAVCPNGDDFCSYGERRSENEG
jgi:hypothetical protein